MRNENEKKSTCKYDVISMGEILLRLSPPENERIVQGELFQKYVGGAELNVISGLSALGLRTGIISKIPDNALGSFTKNKLRSSGVSDEYLLFDKEEDARLGVYYYENGSYPRKPEIVYDRKNSSINKIAIGELKKEVYSSARCLHISGITLALSRQCREVAIELMKKCKEQGTLISFDVNFRGNLWSGAEAKKVIEEILPLVDIFFCSVDTARLTFQKKGKPKDIMKSFTKEYPISIVASTNRRVHSPKNHTFGSMIYEKETDTYYEEEPYQNIEVIDRIGSGDAYISGALYGWLRHLDCRQALEYGNAASAAKNTILGDTSFMNEMELNHIIAEHKSKGEAIEMNR